VNGKKNGKGVFSWWDGSKYEGGFKDNNLEGYGHYFWENRHYKGDWVNNKMEGRGVFTWDDGR